MKARSRWVIVGGITAVILFTALVGIPLLRRERISPDDLASVLKHRDPITEYWFQTRRVRTREGEWRVPHDSRTCHLVRDDGTAIEMGPFAPAQWAFVDNTAAAVTPDGSLVVVWCGSDGTPGQKMAASMFDGKAWAAPVIIARDLNVTCMDAATGPDGRIHVLYISPLVPRESYGMIDGYFPSKIWHVSWQAGQWSQPMPIQSRGRFSVDNVALTVTPSGHVIASAIKTFPFSPQKKLIVQILGERGWGGIHEVGP